VDDRGLSNGVEIALNPSVDEDHKNHVTIVQKNLEAFKVRPLHFTFSGGTRVPVLATD
jgi:hypothetical protein